ncbi:hypothetical protein LINPERPRIM_LOCUS25020 [Linum perenne]
MVMAPLIPLW